MSKKTKATLSDHIHMAAHVHLAETVVRKLMVNRLQHHVWSSSREMNKAHRALDSLNSLKCYLDAIVCTDEPDGIGDYCTHVYYGLDSVFNYEDDVRPILDALAFKISKDLSEQANIDINLLEYDSWNTIPGKEPSVLSDTTLSNLELYESPEYVLNTEQIRDFCEDAIRAGVPPTNMQIENAVGNYRKE